MEKMGAGLVGTCLSIAVSDANNPAPTTRFGQSIPTPVQSYGMESSKNAFGW